MIEAGLLLYVELASMFPNRSGAEVVYLEQAYPRPRFFVPTVFAISAVLLSSVPQPDSLNKFDVLLHTDLAPRIQSFSPSTS